MTSQPSTVHDNPPGSTVAEDGCIRPDTNAEALSTLKPAFDQNGTVTAGTSSPLTDGAAAVLVTSEDFAKAHGLKPLARIRKLGEQWAPWRSVATWYLWRSLDPLPVEY